MALWRFFVENVFLLKPEYFHPQMFLTALDVKVVFTLTLINPKYIQKRRTIHRLFKESSLGGQSTVKWSRYTYFNLQRGRIREYFLILDIPEGYPTCISADLFEFFIVQMFSCGRPSLEVILKGQTIPLKCYQSWKFSMYIGRGFRSFHTDNIGLQSY